MKKKLFLLLAVLTLMLVCLTVSVSADESGTCGDNLTWFFEESTGTLTISGEGNMWDFFDYERPWVSYNDSIKNVIINEGVTSIGSVAFSNCLNLESISLPNSITSIGEYAFVWSGLTNVTIPEGVTEIANFTFRGCTNLESISLPNSITSIGEYAFEGCTNLEFITLPNGITSIGSNAFKDTAITSITIPESVTYIGNSAFESTEITSIVIPDGVTYIGSAAFERTPITSITLPNGITEIAAYTFYGCENLESISLPDSITSIGSAAFVESGLTSITIPESVTYIGNAAFSCTQITSITIPNGVTVIDDYAFEECSNLESITLPNSITSIGHSAFARTPITSITLPDGITEIADYIFEGCTNLESISFPSSITSIGSRAFSDTAFSSITIPESVTYIGDGVFDNCTNLKSITLPNGITSIGHSAFQGTAITSITIPESVTYIGDSAFAYTEITSIVIPDGVTYIGDAAFERTPITSITLPNGITEIADYTFYGCENLESISLPDSITSIGSWAFSDTAFSSITIPDGVTEIGDGVFENCTNLESISLPNSITSIGSNAFYNCNNLKTVTYSGKRSEFIAYIMIGYGNEYLHNAQLICLQPDDTFGQCGDNLTWNFDKESGTLTINGTGDMWNYYELPPVWYVFAEELTNVIINNGVTHIGTNAFYYLPITTVTIGNSVTSIGSYAFAYTGLTNVTIPEGVTEIVDGVFEGCESLESISLPNSITSIGWGAFYGCNNLQTVTYNGKFSDFMNYISVAEGNDCLYNAQLICLQPDDTFGQCGDDLNWNFDTESDTLTISGTGDMWDYYELYPIWYAFPVTNVVINNGVTSIGAYAFWNMPSIMSVTFGNSIVFINEGAFSYCDNLGTVTYHGKSSEFENITIYDGNGYILDANIIFTEVEVHEHSYNAVITAPTCTAQGYTTYTCSCGDSYTDNYVDATGHSFGDWAVVSAPTCTAAGTDRRDCANCDHYETRKVSETGHSYDAVVTAPTCTAQGYTTYTCTVCGNTFERDYIDATGHSFGDWVTVKEPTEEAAGLKERVCSDCGEKETENIPVLEHTHKYNAVITAPTCTTQGYTTYTCTICGDTFDGDHVDATGHSFGDWAVVSAPTCTVAGAERRDCANCDHYETRQISETGHSYDAVTVAPTCTAQGYTTYTCTICGDTFDGDHVDATGHSFGDWAIVSAPTCTVAGTERRDCANCDHYETRKVSATGHSYDAAVTAPTCTAQGYTTYTCTVCGDTFDDNYVDATGHDYKESERVEPACETSGSITYTCACGDSYTDTISAIGHTEVTDSSIAVTCTEDGLTEGKHCSVCGKVITAQEAVPALGHDFAEDFTVDVEPTTESAGQKSRHCTRCDEVTDVTEMPKLTPPVDTSKVYKDVKSKSWFKSAVDFVVTYGLMNGMTDDSFEPNTTMSRAMLVTVLWRLEGSPATDIKVPFTDLKQAWYKDAVAWAYENSIVNGTAEDKFSPNGNITREQMAAILYRYSQYKEYDTSARADISSFPDAGRVHDYALEAIAWANAEGLITGTTDNGTTILAPRASATRAQVATILMRFCEK